MKQLLSVAVLVFVLVTCANAQRPYPILFVTVVPTPNDSSTQTAAFSNHITNPYAAPRGGDLMILYTDGTSKNLTATAGYGVATGLQGANAISVREPSVHWNGNKALFSMIVGAPATTGDTTIFYWQIYEITGLGKNETPVITKVPNQPANYNNTSPIYGTDDRIIFTSDRPLNGATHLYPAFDEYKNQLTNTGLWSLNSATGDLLLLDHSPSGDFTPIIDSYGRVLVMRWDRLQRDGTADKDALGTANKGTFNYTDETPNGTPQYNVRTETFPEPQGSRTDLLTGTNMVGMEFNRFSPWQINEDGSELETINHIGRHEFLQSFNRAINDDPNVVIFNYANTTRSNRNPITNFLYVKEDPTTPGSYIGVDCFQAGTHAAGQIVKVTASPNLDPDQSVFTYITHRTTSFFTFEGNTPNTNHSGMYRNPLPLSNGSIIASHSVNTFADKNLGSRTFPISRYAFRLKSLTLSGSVYIAGQNLTQGFSKSLTYYDPDSLVTFNGELWEVDAVEVRPRAIPTKRTAVLPNIEQQVFTEENVDETKFRSFLTQNKLALVVSRDITHRDKTDKQQPFYLRVAGTNHQSANIPQGSKVYDVSHMQFYQGDYLRGQGMTSPSSTPHPGRRILAVKTHDGMANNPNTGVPSAVQLGTDGSMAAFVPAGRANSWQLVAPTTATPIVRERYWVTFKSGEIRVCASCHGTNDAATTHSDPAPQNKPEALRDLLKFWRATNVPNKLQLSTPVNGAVNQLTSLQLTWQSAPKATQYHIQLSATSSFTTTIKDVQQSTLALDVSGLADGATYYWRAQAIGDYGTGDWSDTWSFTVKSKPNGVLGTVQLVSPTDGKKYLQVYVPLTWSAVANAAKYQVQRSNTTTFAVLTDNLFVTATNTTINALFPKTTHYWRVRAINNTDTGAWSTTWKFTIAPELLTSTALISPPNKSQNVVPATTLLWSEKADAESYHVEVTSGGKPVADTVTTLTSWSRVFATNTSYTWRVRAMNPADSGVWSETWEFNTNIPASVTDEPAADAKLYPVPAGEHCTIEWNQQQAGNCKITVTDIRGREVLKVFDGAIADGTQRKDISTTALPAGEYVVRIYTANRIIRLKMMIER